MGNRLRGGAVADPIADQNFRGLAQDLQNLENRSARSFGLVTSLPAKPAAGAGATCIYKADATNGVYWNLVYDGTGEFPWKKIGGPPLIARVDTLATLTAENYTTIAGGPEVTIPLKGDYVLQHGCQAQLTGGSSSNAYAAIYLGETLKSETEAFAINIDQFEGSSIVSAPVNTTGIAASTVARQRYKGFTTTLSWNYSRRWLLADPVRVG